MFGKLKEKLAKVRKRIAEKLAGEEALPPLEGAPKPSAPELVQVEGPERSKEELVPPLPLPPQKPKREVRRAVKRLLAKKLSPKDVEDIVWDLEVALLESDVALPVANHVLNRVKSGLTERKVGIRENPREIADEILRAALREILTPTRQINILEVIESKRAVSEPTVMVFLGINGHGKTTTIAKLAKYLRDRGYKTVLAAADTFRAAGIEQLEIHAQRLGVPVIKQRRGADAAAVAYDAVAHAKAKGLDVVLVDTAGRMQTDRNLMDEMCKIVRVAKPDLVIFVGDALTGNDAVEQAKAFNEAVGIHGSILCKMDADARGGAALSITYVTKAPILFLGTGQRYEDLVEFKPELIINSLLGD
jgi:fused signal recognition particle receptor